ncbi:MAG TPA: ATP-binding cassette domain-containing protein [Spirochaetota bacterium]|nr:ATP-binding cassette domain-containing protein [Spirochaetota bacterium]
MNREELLRVESVSLTDAGGAACGDVSFSMTRGENLVIFGPEDSGAEVVCPLIAGTVISFDGEIFFKGRSVESYDYVERHNYRKELGYLQKNYGLINNMSVEENIELPLRYHSRLSSGEIGSLVNRLIGELGLEHCRALRPVSLSGSETLRTAYCRSIALDPDLLLIEHALEGQCLLNSRQFLRALGRWCQRDDRSVIIVTYEPGPFVDFSDRFIMLYEGNIVFSGSRGDFLARQNDYLDQYMRSSLDGPMKVR